MKLYEVTHLKIVDSMIIAAESQADAAVYLAACLRQTIGDAPEMAIKLREAIVDDMMTERQMVAMVEERRRGIAWDTDDGWKLIDPFDRPDRLF